MSKVWKDIIGFENEYKVSNYGDVYSYKTKRILTPINQVYRYVNIGKGTDGYNPIYIHKLVAQCFLDNYNNSLYIDHIDGDKYNNHISNLRLCSQSENMCNRKAQSNNKLGLKGICKRTNRNSFIAQLKKGDKRVQKQFTSLIEAIKWYNVKSKEIHGEFGYIHPIPDEDVFL